MPSMRKQRLMVNRLRRNRIGRSQDDKHWEYMPAVGREWGSPDFERLLEGTHGDFLDLDEQNPVNGPDRT